MIEVLELALVGGLLALDATSVGQFMISRPLAAGAIAGWLVGDPALGISVGAILELYLLVSFPTGGSRFPEGPTATVVAVASAAAVGEPGALPAAVAFGLVWGQLGGYTVTGLRRLNGHLVPEPDGGQTHPGRVVRAHFAALALDLGRGGLVTATGVIVGRLVVGLAARTWPLSVEASTGLLLVGAAVSLGILLRDLGGFGARRVLFVAGMALAIVGARIL